MESETSSICPNAVGEESEKSAFDPFSPDYQTARRRFLNSANRLGWRVLSYPLDLKGPAGETLSLDAAISPGRGSQTLVISSGLHGVEGFFGSAVELAWMESSSRNAESPVRQVLLHALNPYGFAYRRRVNEENVDLNRNFLLDGKRYAGCPADYSRLDEFLNPKSPPTRRDFFTLKALALIARHGKANLQQAIAAGQYEYPKGLFYGGKEPSWLQRLLSQHLDEWLGGSRDVVHLDLHTGLGPWGECNILVDYPLKPHLENRLQTWFGRGAFEAYASKSVNYQAQGGLGRWLAATQPKRDYSFAFVEFGTYGAIQILEGLRAENRAHYWDKATPELLGPYQATLVELFCPANAKWRQRVIEKSLERLAQATKGLESAG